MHRDYASSTATAKLRQNEIRRVKDLLFQAGISLRDVDRIYQLPTGVAGRTLVEPNTKGERAIAAALKTRPHLLWRSRYQANGARKAPQPSENYQRLPTMRERRSKHQATKKREAA